MLDFDGGGVLAGEWGGIVKEQAPDLLDRLVVEQSPSGACHVVYRCEAPVARNQKLARRAVLGGLGNPAALIETRGEGGLFLCAPTPGYTLLQGTFANVPLLTAAERETLIEAARLLGVSRTLFYGLLSAARDPVGLRLGRCRRWSVDELRAWTAAGAPPLSRWSSTRGRL
jgi:predicted DNA-binding transcriptional regulator AlpA